MQPTILIAAPAKDDRILLKQAFPADGTLVFEAMNGTRFLEILHRQSVDLVFLDIGLPGGLTGDFIDSVRQRSKAPIIAVGAAIDLEKKEGCTRKGVNQFIVKPFVSCEIQACAALSLLSLATGAAHNVIAPPPGIEFGGWVLDRARRRVHDAQAREAGLTFQEYQLLEKLALAPGRVLSRDDLAGSAGCDRRAIDVKITRIRKKIRDRADQNQIIKTVRGAGYMLACPAKLIDH